MAGYLEISGGGFNLICLVGLGLMTAGGLTVVVSLLPLRRLKSQLERVRRGTKQQVHGSYPEEVQPLVDHLNTLLRNQQEALRRSRVEADNLAHGLKTPLAILSTEIEQLSAAPDSSTEQMSRQVQAMIAHIEVHLSRARAAAAQCARPAEAEVEVAPVVDDLLRTLRRLYDRRGLTISSAAAPGSTVRMDRQDLAEILGNVLDNACKWATRRVEIRVRQNSGRVSIAIEDDGPGLGEAERSALERGARIAGPAEEKEGSGMGLSIVRTLVDFYQVSWSVQTSDLGGLRVVLDFPPDQQAVVRANRQP